MAIIMIDEEIKQLRRLMKKFESSVSVNLDLEKQYVVNKGEHEAIQKVIFVLTDIQ